MTVPETARRASMPRRRGGKAVAFAGSLLLCSVPGCCLVSYTSERFTCLYCRLYKEVVTYASIPLHTLEESACSQWYSSAFPGHDHEWIRSTCGYYRPALSLPGLIGCNFRPSIWKVPVDRHQKFLMRVTPEEREQFFADMKAPDVKLVKEAIQRAIRIAAAHDG